MSGGKTLRKILTPGWQQGVGFTPTKATPTFSLHLSLVLLWEEILISSSFVHTLVFDSLMFVQCSSEFKFSSIKFQGSVSILSMTIFNLLLSSMDLANRTSRCPDL